MPVSSKPPNVPAATIGFDTAPPLAISSGHPNRESSLSVASSSSPSPILTLSCSMPVSSKPPNVPAATIGFDPAPPLAISSGHPNRESSLSVASSSSPSPILTLSCSISRASLSRETPRTTTKYRRASDLTIITATRDATTIKPPKQPPLCLLLC
ncbi:hypothetical protein L2E82_22629 [Cichorium intybus]|uniref:Uncharacterized protein n=1 Tax=Cichorium intybus TaxID=13427 RepID=A0ACB9DZ98_CICIN|nr:hypothetical protein L2E82_22629 [Cichorium intybus]